MSAIRVVYRLRRLFAFTVVALLLLMVCTMFAAGSAYAKGSQKAMEVSSTSQIASSAVLTDSASLYLPMISGGPDTTCSTLPMLLEPADGAQLDTLIPVFKWTFSPDPQTTDLRLELSIMPNFETITNRYESAPSYEEMWFPFNLLADTTYYWRIMIFCNEAEGPYTAIRSFHTGANGVVPAAAQLSEPADGAETSSTITFRWQAVDQATQYGLYYHRAGAPGTQTESVDGTSVTLELESGVYEWWVRARSSYAFGPESARWQITVK